MAAWSVGHLGQPLLQGYMRMTLRSCLEFPSTQPACNFPDVSRAENSTDMQCLKANHAEL